MSIGMRNKCKIIGLSMQSKQKIESIVPIFSLILKVAIAVSMIVSAAAMSRPVCNDRPIVTDSCAIDFEIRANGRASEYLPPLGCQFNLVREINRALLAKGYDLEKFGKPPSDDQMWGAAIAALQCEQRRAGLPVTGRLDRATIKVVLGYDLLLNRCRFAGSSASDCPILRRPR